MKALADDKFSVVKMIISVFGRVENIAGKGENAVFEKDSDKGVAYSRECVVKS